MQATLTVTAAKELGRDLRFIRTSQSLTLRDAAKGASLSPQYVQNIERGERVTVSEDAYVRLGRAIGMPDADLLDRLLRARVKSALELRHIDEDGIAFVWRGVEQRLGEVGVELHLDLAQLLTTIYLHPERTASS